MSAPQFTPGPWRVEEGTTLVWGACNTDDGTSYSMGVPVAEATVWQPQWAEKRHAFHSSEPETNARLIAAAPELYEALEAARREIVYHLRGNETLVKSSVAIHGIDAALAKARGEA